MTKGINQTLDISLQIMLWQIIDDFKDTKEIELDYLQVFKIRRNKNELIIEHTQEVPFAVSCKAIKCIFYSHLG